MAKTLVNIITEDNPIPAYLFIKEMFSAGDRLIYISAKDTEDDLDALSELFSIPASQIDEIVLKHDIDELTYEKICRAILVRLNHETHYCVNLAGGTRYMALAVQQVFEKFDSKFYYVHVEDNVIVQSVFDDRINNNDDLFFPIRHRMTISEYLHAHEIENNLSNYPHLPIRSESESQHMFDLFTQHGLSVQDFDVLETLRLYYRGRKRINILNTETSTNPKRPAVPHLSSFLNKICFIPQNKGVLTRDELDYLTGGWFEEYVFYLIKKFIKPQDLAINVKISRKGIRHNNELDVVFTKGNKLFVIECKTGVQTEHLFNEIVYKLCAVSESLLGVSCFSYIFSLKKDDDGMLKRIASLMDISFIDNDILLTPRKLRLAMAGIEIMAKERNS